MRIWLRCLAFVATLAVSASASATSAILVSEVEQAALSDAVVVATVTEQVVSRHAEWGRAVTRSTVSVEQVLLGDAPASLTINQLGGELDGELLYIPGDARLEVGQRLVLFLKSDQGEWYLTAMEQSSYDIVPTIDGDTLERELSSGLFVRDDKGLLVEFHGDVTSAPTLYDLSALLMNKPTRTGVAR